MATRTWIVKDTRDTLNALVDQMTTNPNKYLGFVGAGFGASLGYPLWDRLLDLMEEQIYNTVGKRVQSQVRKRVAAIRNTVPGDKLWLAEFLCRELGRGPVPLPPGAPPTAYDSFLTATFGPRAIKPLHEKFVKLALRHVLTTNYDSSLEQAHQSQFGVLPPHIDWADTSPPSDLAQRDFFTNVQQDGYERRYVHVHGYYANPALTILTEADYKAAYDRPSYKDRLFAIFGQQRLLIAGYSLQDMDVMNIFRRVRVHTTTAQHYAILALPPGQDPEELELYLDAKYGVKPILYYMSPNHEGLEEIVGLLPTA